MKEFVPVLKKLARGEKGMIRTLERWVGCNSASNHPKGLAKMAGLLKKAFSKVGDVEEVKLEQGTALTMRKRPEAPVQIFLGGHMDTVFSKESAFQKATIQGDKMIGPGAADMKGGLLVMLKALEALEASPYKENLGWQVVINSDEEIGSPNSRHLFTEAKGFHAALLFEPTYPDGSLVSERKGSANFRLEAKGKAAHAGRAFFEGKNAICALAQAILDMSMLSDPEQNITVNIGRIRGGGPVNIIPDHAHCHLNVRAETAEDFVFIREALDEIVAIDPALSLHEEGMRAPKPFDKHTEELFGIMQSVAKDLGQNLSWRSSGGVCDGNLIASAGIPTLDTLGVVGGNLHTEEEYMLLSSLVDKAQLAALFLMQFAKEASR